MRRNARLRREYLYRKSLEGKQRIIYEKKKKIKEAIEQGKSIPTELREEQEDLREDIQYDDIATEEPKSHIDDEYVNAGIYDPKILITTSHDPSSRLKQFAKEIKLIFPNSQRINRGNRVMKEIVDTCRSSETTDLIILHEHRGEPDGMIVSHLPFGPTAYFGIINCVMRHDVKTNTAVSEAYPHLIFNNFNTKLGERVMNIMKYLFPVPKDDSKRVITFANQNDYISFRHHIFSRTGAKEIELDEVGPRFELILYQIKLGTVDMDKEAENEYVLRSYTNTARKRDVL